VNDRTRDSRTQGSATHWDVFLLLCECLSVCVAARRPRMPSSAVPWSLLVEAADGHLVAPALGWCLRGDERVPADVRECFETLLELNRHRNTIMLEALGVAVEALNEADIKPMVLKGAAALVEDLYPDSGMRILGDLDLLVRETELADATAALERARFFETSVGRPQNDLHHLPLRTHAVLGTGLELHRRPLPQHVDGLLQAQAVFDHAEPRTWRGHEILVPGLADWIVHSAAHGQIVDGRYLRGIPQLRQLLELAMLRSRDEDGTAMRQAADRFDHAGHGDVFSNAVRLSEGLLEQPDTDLQSSDVVAAVRRLKAVVERPVIFRWSVYRRFLSRHARRLIMEPRAAMKAMHPSTWMSELAAVRQRLRVRRW
jgi:hypothetical protein